MPDLVDSMIPAEHRTLVLQQYEKAATAAYRETPESVVDRCREAAAAALNAARTLYQPEGKALDLTDLAAFFASEQFGSRGGRLILSNAARIIARLHSKGKSAEQVNHRSVAPTEADAECVLALLGTIYRDLGWSKA
ncbi:hypothetical protein [Paraburkholderia caffeinitolerans]|uniref:hypothetical protein n=1 Tax=Paraburkholderia caffeinitolerans TaxID=1723730 RepID=UPI00366A7AAE